jgi:hypothetical protein
VNDKTQMRKNQTPGRFEIIMITITIGEVLLFFQRQCRPGPASGSVRVLCSLNLLNASGPL